MLPSLYPLHVRSHYVQSFMYLGMLSFGEPVLAKSRHTTAEYGEPTGFFDIVMSGEMLTVSAGVADQLGRAHLGGWGAAREDELPVSTEDGVEKRHLLGETVVRLKVLWSDLDLMVRSSIRTSESATDQVACLKNWALTPDMVLSETVAIMEKRPKEDVCGYDERGRACEVID